MQPEKSTARGPRKAWHDPTPRPASLRVFNKPAATCNDHEAVEVEERKADGITPFDLEPDSLEKFP